MSEIGVQVSFRFCISLDLGLIDPFRISLMEGMLTLRVA